LRAVGVIAYRLSAHGRIRESIHHRLTLDFHDPAASEVRFRDAMVSAGNESGRLELQTQLARTLGLQRRFDEAHHFLDEVEAALHKHAHDACFAPAVVRYLLERGRVLNISGEQDQPRKLFRQAFDLGMRARLETLAIDAAHMIANVSAPELAMQWNRRALSLAEFSSDARARQWRGSLHNNIGWTLHELGRFIEALRHFQAALACRQHENNPREQRIAAWCVARCLRSMGQIEEARIVLTSLLPCSPEGGLDTAYLAEELAECLRAQGHHAEAAHQFKRAHRLLESDPAFVAAHPQRLARVAELSRQAPQ